MKDCVVFCAGEFTGLAEKIRENALVVAADGGWEHARRAGATPQIVLGDFDSLGFVPEGAKVYPTEKDDTDAMLAVRVGLKAGCQRFLLYGSLDGPRLDHTMANFQTLLFLANREAQGYLVGKKYIATVVKNGWLTFPPENTGVVSVFCLGADARGVTIKGLKYSLEDGRLSAGLPLGVSNQFLGQQAEISVADGSLLVLWDRENGFPWEQTGA